MTRHQRVLPLILALAVAVSVSGCAGTPGEFREAAEPETAADGAIPPEDRWIGKRHDPPTGPTFDGIGSNVRVNQDFGGFDQNETSIAVSRVDPLHLIAGANDYRTGSVKCGYYRSTDGGQTWTDGTLPEETYTLQGDPAVAFCADDTAIYLCLSFEGAFQPHGLFAYRSKNDVTGWDGPFEVLNRPEGGTPFADKPWVGCDSTSGPFSNRVYATWTEITTTQRIAIRHSTDRGSTWSNTRIVSNTTVAQGSVIAIGPDGTVHVAWRDTSGLSLLGYDRSFNGGESFGVDSFPAEIRAISQDPVFRRNSHPTMDVDRSDGPHSGNVYVAWSDRRNVAPDILLIRSIDGGETWSEPIRVNDDEYGNGRDQWFPWLSVDPEGRVIVSFFDRRRDPGNRDYEIWGAISRDGGQTFDTNFLVSDTPSDGGLNDFIGDYSGLATTSDALYPLWTDLRAETGESDVYTDRYPNIFHYDEVRGLAWDDRDHLHFETQDVRFDQVLDYDVASGLLSDLRTDAAYDRVECAAAAWPGPPFVDTRVPPADGGYYYLVRVNGPDGVGTYGYGSPARRPNVRDPLDHDVPACP